MSSIIKSVSLDSVEDDFLKEYKLSPTSLLKEKIWEMKGMIKRVAHERIQRMINTVEGLVREKGIMEKELAELKEKYVLEKENTGTKEQ